MKEKEINIAGNIIKVVISKAMPENCTLFLNPRNAEILKGYLKKIEGALKEKKIGRTLVIGEQRLHRIEDGFELLDLLGE